MRFARRYSNSSAAGQALVALLNEARAEAQLGIERHVKTAPARARRLTEGERTGLANDYRRGLTVYDLAEKYGVQRQTVSKHLHAMGVTMRQQGLSETQVDRAVELYVDERLTLKQVGVKLGADAGTVRLALLRRGVRMRAAVAPRAKASDVTDSF